MEYRKCLKGNTLKNEIVVTIPDLYVNVEKGYKKVLEKRRAELDQLVEENKKKNKQYFVFLLLGIFAALAVVSVVIEAILGKGLSLIIPTIACALALAFVIAAPIANAEKGRRMEKQKAKAKAYAKDSIQFKTNEYLYGTLQYTRIENLIMSAGKLTLYYTSTDGVAKCDTFEYEEWEGDNDLKTPFLVFENTRLYGRSNMKAESTAFTTSIVTD